MTIPRKAPATGGINHMTEVPMADDRSTAENTAADCESEGESADAPSADEALEEAERERDQFKALALRYAADLDNYKKRAAQDMDTLRERANERLLLKVADFADNFDRALQHAPSDNAGDAWTEWAEGVRIAMRGMDSMLSSEGVSRIETAVGDPFDPNLHDALFQHPTDEVEEGAVSAVIQNGYTLGDRVLRAAQVGVAQATAAAPQKQEQDAEPRTGAATQQETN